MATELETDLAAMIDEPVIEDLPMRALRRIWLEALMADLKPMESFEDVADLIQDCLIPD